jgi:hypothetical protein
MNKRVASAGLAAGLLAGGAAGLALGVTTLSSAATESTAAAGTDTTTDGSATTDDNTSTTTDDSTGSTTDDGAADERPARGEWLQDALQPLVDDGTITQAQADAVIAALQDARPAGGFGHGPGGRHGGFGHGPGFGHGGRFGRLEDAATALGMTEDELLTALRDGSTIAEIAAEKGVELQTIVDAMLAELKAHLDDEVAEGDLTQEEADAKLAEVTERLTERLNQAKVDADAPGADSTDTTTS